MITKSGRRLRRRRIRSAFVNVASYFCPSPSLAGVLDEHSVAMRDLRYLYTQALAATKRRRPSS